MELKKNETDQATDERASMATEIGRLRIEALAQSAGAVDAKAVAEVVAKSAKYEIDAGNVKIAMVDPETGDQLRMPNADAMTPGQFIAQMKASPDTGYLFQDGAAGKPKAKTTGGLQTETNPWHRDSFNLTEQARLLKNDPATARIYQEVARGTLPDNPFSADGHNLTRQAQIMRDNPALAERMRAEVAPKEPNPWMKGSENLTKQVLMIRSNPEKARRLQAEAEVRNGPAPKKSYIFTPPPGSFKRLGTGR